VKTVFGNEIGTLCKAMGIDGQEVMRVFCADEKLNISKAYLTPGFAYGGSCLPKDLRALMHRARMLHVEVPMLANVQRSNDAHIVRALDQITRIGKRRVGLLGLSFKRGTDDLRESPLVELVERLIGKGCQVRIFDENVSLARLMGGNKAYIEQKLPHVSELLVEDLEHVIDESEIVVVGTSSPRFAEVLRKRGGDKIVVDFVRLFGGETPPVGSYHGVCW
jgi:GDP-mannose 6-dehydrogenase